MTRRTLYILIGSLLTILLISIITVALLGRKNADETSIFSTDTSILSKDALNELPKKTASTASLSRLADDVTPPTNSRISGLALQ